MKFIIIVSFFLPFSVAAQIQWFPAKYDSATTRHYIDTSSGFPVSFIKIQNNNVFMYGHGTNYQTQMRSKGNGYFSDYLTMPVKDSSDIVRISYRKAKYFFATNKNMGTLIINRINKTDTLLFIKSKMKFKNINAKWG